MPVISESKDYVVFVGGLGWGSGCGDPGGCTKEFWGQLEHPDKDLPDVMDSNGGNLSAAGAGLFPWSCTVTNNGSGKLRITYSAGFENCVPGLLAKCTFAATYTTSRYEILDYDDVSYNWIDIDETYVSDTTCACAVGGAFAQLSSAVDDTDANGTSPHNVYILCNVDITFTSPTNQIDLDSGGDLAAGTRKRIISTNNHGVPNSPGTRTVINVNSQTGAVGFDWGDCDNVSIEHFRIHGSLVAGIRMSASVAHYSLQVIDCYVHNCPISISATTDYNKNLEIIGGILNAGASNECLKLKANNVIAIGTYLYATNDTPVEISGACSAFFSGCVFRGGGAGTTYPIFVSNAVNLHVEDCTFFYFLHGICLNHVNACLTEYGNIFYLSTAATSRAIYRSSGTVRYSNYSILWCYNGAPTANYRWGQQEMQYVPYNALETNPEFIDASNDDFRLSGTSPAIRASMPTLGQIDTSY